MQMAAQSAFMNKKGHKRAVAMTWEDIPLRLQISLPQSQGENEHSGFSIKGQGFARAFY